MTNLIDKLEDIIKEKYIGDLYYVPHMGNLVGDYGIKIDEAEEFCNRFNAAKKNGIQATFSPCNDFDCDMDGTEILDALYPLFLEYKKSPPTKYMVNVYLFKDTLAQWKESEVVTISDDCFEKIERLLLAMTDPKIRNDNGQ